MGLLPHRSAQISIHALRVEGDVPFFLARAVAHKISIHALRVEGDDHVRFILSAK